MKISYYLQRLSILAILFVSYSTFACNFQLKLADSYGNGWDVARVTVYVNGTAVLTDKTLASGYGPTYFTFTVNTGDLITTNYTHGSYSSQNEYWILNANGDELAHEGANGTAPGDITTAISAVCPGDNDLKLTSWISPVWGASPSATMSISIKVDNIGELAQSGFDLKYSIDGGSTFVTESYSGSFAAGSSITHVFSTSADMSAGGMFHCVAVINNTGDMNTSNDTIYKEVYLCTTLSGNYTIGLGAGNDFSTIQLAVDALASCGVSGPVTFNINPGIYNERIVFIPVTGASAINTITFQSATGNAEDVVITNDVATISTNYTIKLNGADYFTIRDLTVKATHYRFASVISVENNAFHNVFYGNRIISESSDSDSKAFFDYGNDNNNYNTYRKNIIEGAYYSFYINGKGSTNLTIGTQIDSNDISHYFKSGMNLYYHDSIKISSNNLHDEGAAAEYGVDLFSIYNGFGILNNRVLMNNSNRFTAIRLSYGNHYSYVSASALPGLVANNMISMTSDQNGNPIKTGLSIENCDSVVIANNSILIANGSWSSNALKQSNNSSNTHGCKFVNNIFANFDEGYAAYFSSPSSVSSMDNNNYYSTNSSKFVYWNGNKPNLVALQTASGKDANSISSPPLFFSYEDLHTLAYATSNTGVSVSGVTVDFDGEIRDILTPDIGADEYTQFNVDMKVDAWVLPVDTVTINTGNAIKISVTNTGISPVTNVPVKYSIDNGQSFVTETISGTIQPDSSVAYTFATLANFPSFGNTHCMALTNVAGELNPLNDTVFTDIFACSPLTGVYTLGFSESNDFSSFPQLSKVLEHCGVSGPVTINVDPGLYDGKTKFYNVTGASLINTITIIGRGLETKLINTKAFEYGREVFEFDNAKFFILDSLYISENVHSDYFTGVRFHNQSDTNTIKNCIINIGGTSYGFGIVSSWSSHSSASGGDNGDGLVIDNNTVYGGMLGIQLSGNNAYDLNNDNHITNNTLYGSGISAYAQDAIEIAGNTLEGAGISVSTSRNGLVLANNHIDADKKRDALLVEYHNYYGGSDTALVYNNTVINYAQPGGVATAGIHSSYNKYTVYYNNSIRMIGSSQYAKAFWVKSATTSSIIIKNNIIANFAGGYVYMVDGATSTFENDYNILYSNSSRYCYINSSSKANLAEWKTVTSDAAHSVSQNPYYFSDHDVRSVAINDLGIPLDSVLTDIDGISRSASTPDIGAYEYDIPTTVDLGSDTSLCVGTSLILTANVVTDYTGFEYIWVNAMTGDTLTGVSKTFDIDSTGTYAVHVVHGSGYTLSDTIVISSSVVVDFTGLLANYCEGDSSSVLVGSPLGGAFSGIGVTGSSFDPVTAGIGTHSVTYTYTDAGSSCTVEVNKSTTVHANPVLNMSNDTAICVGDSIDVFATDTQVANHTYFWTTGETTFSINVSPSLNSVYYVTISNGNCSAIDSVVVNVNALPTPSFTGLDTAYCQNDPASTLLGIPAGGVFSGSGISGTMFNPITTGTNIVTYLYTDSVTTCSNTFNGNTIVNTLPNNSILGLDTSYCVSDTLVGLNFFPAADSVSGTGIIQPNVFDPALANVGTHDIIFIYTDANSCTNSDTMEVTVHSLPIVTLTGLDANYCLNDANDTLVGLPIGGYYIGPGAYPEIFEPSIVGMGTHDIIYIYPDVFGCVSSDTVSTIVHGLPTVTLPSDTTICANNSMVLDAGSFTGYLWSNGETTQTITVDSTGNGIGTSNISVVVSDQNTCEGTDSINIIFEAMPISILEDTATICGLDNEILLTASSNTGYDFLWSTGSTGTAILVNTTDLGGSTGYISVSIATLIGCTTYDTAYVLFREIPTPFIGNDTTVCWNKTIVLDAGSGYSVYTWSTGESTQTISLDSTVFYIGSNEVTVEVTNTENCTNSDTIALEVDICTGILTPELRLENINVFPNPSNGNVEIELTGLQNKEYHLGVYNSVGAIVFDENFENNGAKKQTWNLDLSSRAKGVYFIQLQSERGIRVERLVVQ